MGKETKISIMIADDHLLFVEGVQVILMTQPDFIVPTIAHDGKQLLEILNHEKPDIILLDINMPIMNGPNALHYIRQRHQL